MKHIFLIIMTICMVMTTGCGRASSTKEIDYLNLTLEDLKNINWDMTLDEFKEGIGDVEFEEEKFSGEKQLTTIDIDNFSFNDMEINPFGLTVYFDSDKLDGLMIGFSIPNDEMESFFKKCKKDLGKPSETSKNGTTTYWIFDKTAISYNGESGCLFMVEQYNGETE